MGARILDRVEWSLATSQEGNRAGFQNRNQTAHESLEVFDRAVDQPESAPSVLALEQNNIQEKRGAAGSGLRQTDQNRCPGRLVTRPRQALHPHPTIARLELLPSVLELNAAVRLKGRTLPEPILITTNGTILGGFSDWHEAVCDGQAVFECIEYSLSDEEALEFVLIHHQPQRIWNNFNRARLALELEPYFQKKAVANQSAGGRHKGSANLPKAERIVVCEEIAAVAGVSARTVSNVKKDLSDAASPILKALQAGTLTINGAMRWCTLPKRKQIEQFAESQAEGAVDKVIRHAIAQCEICVPRNIVTLLEALGQREAQEPGSVVMRIGTRRQTVILLGKDLLSQPPSGAELKEI